VGGDKTTSLRIPLGGFGLKLRPIGTNDKMVRTPLLMPNGKTIQHKTRLETISNAAVRIKITKKTPTA